MTCPMLKLLTFGLMDQVVSTRINLFALSRKTARYVQYEGIPLNKFRSSQVPGTSSSEFQVPGASSSEMPK